MIDVVWYLVYYVFWIGNHVVNCFYLLLLHSMFISVPWTHCDEYCQSWFLIDRMRMRMLMMMLTCCGWWLASTKMTTLSHGGKEMQGVEACIVVVNSLTVTDIVVVVMMDVKLLLHFTCIIDNKWSFVYPHDHFFSDTIHGQLPGHITSCHDSASCKQWSHHLRNEQPNSTKINCRVSVCVGPINITKTCFLFFGYVLRRWKSALRICQPLFLTTCWLVLAWVWGFRKGWEKTRGDRSVRFVNPGIISFFFGWI